MAAFPAAVLLFLASAMSTSAAPQCKSGYSRPASLSGDMFCYGAAQVPSGPSLSQKNRWVVSAPTAVYYCAKEYTSLILPKTPQQEEWARAQAVLGHRNAYFPPAYPPSLYVGAANLAGYWAWFDNATFPLDRWCPGQGDPSQQLGCAVLQWPDPNGPGCFIVEPGCGEEDFGAQPSALFQAQFTQWICQESLNATAQCPAGFIGRPESEDCYHVAKSLDMTNWIDGLCECYAHSSYLSDVHTLHEAIFIAGLARSLSKDGMSIDTQFLIGISSLYPISEWTWANDWPLENYTKMFWEGKTLPPEPRTEPPMAPEDGLQCASIMWREEGGIPSGMFPELRPIKCTTGAMSAVCKMTPATRRGEFPDTVRRLADELCPR